MSVSEIAKMLRENPDLMQKICEQEQLGSLPLSLCDVDGSGSLTIENLQEYLRLKGLSVRFNEITHQTEFIGWRGENKTLLPNTAPSIIFNELKPILPKFCTEQRIADYLGVVASRNCYNPVLERISGVAWDKRDRLSELFRLIHIDGDELGKRLFTCWLKMCICALHNSADHPFSLDIVLILRGRQGTGKTRLIEALALDSDWFAEGLSIDVRSKDSVVQCTSKWIAELGEIGSTLRRDVDSLKAFLSSASDEVRLPYARAALRYPRRCCFCGTTNDAEFLLDSTGNRRFAVIPLPDDLQIKCEDIRRFDFLQLWAQINELVEQDIKNGESFSSCFRLDRETLKAAEARNAERTKPLPAEMEILDILGDSDGANYKVVYEEMTLSEFKEINGSLKTFSVVQISAVLKKLGYSQSIKKVDGRTKRLYELPRRKYNGYP